ncbi:hypothetical protein ACFLYS_01970 [Chloroflexota bacterium]
MRLKNSNILEVGLSGGDELRRRISILFTVVALLLLMHSIITARFEVGDWGLVHGLPVTFFIALALLITASALLWVSTEKQTKLLSLQIITIIMSLAMVPLITGGSISYINHGYRNLGYVEYIVRQGHFDTSFTFYLSWPGAFILPSIVTKLCQLDYASLIEVLPAFIPIISLLPLYIFLKNTLGESRIKYILAGCLIYFLAGGSGAGNIISAMGTATVLLIILMALITDRRIWHSEGDSRPVILIIMIIFTAIVMSHLLTSLAALAIIGALALFRRDIRLVWVTIGCLAILLAWNLTVAGDYLIPKLPFIGEGKFIFSLDILTEREVTGHLVGTGSHADVATVRVFHAALFLLTGFAGFISSLVVKRDLKATVSLAVITLIPIPLAVLSGYYAQEIITRIYGFIMPGIAYFSTRLFDINKKLVAVVICLLLILAVPMKLVSAYGNQEFDYISPAQRAGTDFFHAETNQGMVFGAWPLGDAKNTENYTNFELHLLRWDENRIPTPVWLIEYGYEKFYIGINRQNRADYEWIKEDPEFITDMKEQLQNTLNANLLYYNPDLSVYVFYDD